jgi:energy-coupling factor transporter ATP-binding protein EcfA2
MDGCRVVELLGPPGSGKSTLAAALTSMDGSVLVKDHAARDLPALARAAGRAGSTYFLQRPTSVPAVRHAAWLVRLGAASDVVARRARAGASLVVLDQGPAYTLGRLRHLCVTGPGRAWWGRHALGTARLLDLVIVLDADPGTLAHRLRNRDKPHHAQRLGSRDLLAYLREEQDRARTVARVLREAGAQCLELSTGTGSADDAVHAVLERIAPVQPLPGSLGQ